MADRNDADLDAGDLPEQPGTPLSDDDGDAIAAIPLVDDAHVPPSFRALIRRSLGGMPGMAKDHLVSGSTVPRRRAAVLMLLADGADGPDLLLTQRAGTLRDHAGQPAFPGGALEPDEDAVTAALREAREETGLDPDGVTPLVLLPPLYLPASGYLVHPVLAHWHRPGPVGPVDPAETALVARVPISSLADPANRVRVRYQTFLGDGFAVAGMVVWGFTGTMVAGLLDLGGWSVPWLFPHTTTIDLTPGQRSGPGAAR